MSVLQRLRATLTAACAVVLLSTLVGCSFNGPVYNNYTLVATSPVVTARDGLPATLGVFPVKVPGWLDKNNIIWSRGGVLLQVFENNYWGEPLPELLTQAMVNNLRRQAGSQTWVSVGPWFGNARPEMVMLVEVQSITVVDQQMQVSVAWTVQGNDNHIIVQQEKTYELPDGGVSVQDSIETLSQVWGLVTEDVITTLVQTTSK